ncbi:hypothetical protein GCM10023333_31420 [Ferrimonas pelagia]|uniref:Uncharacterized protein n=1 Tax=Ferrimonas pelagia TaxID=1177826 RepID=A0ABP9F9P2_9GAMM
MSFKPTDGKSHQIHHRMLRDTSGGNLYLCTVYFYRIGSIPIDNPFTDDSQQLDVRSTSVVALYKPQKGPYRTGG